MFKLNNLKSILVLFHILRAIYTSWIIDKLSNMNGHHESNTVQIQPVSIFSMENYTPHE